MRKLYEHEKTVITDLLVNCFRMSSTKAFYIDTEADAAFESNAVLNIRVVDSSVIFNNVELNALYTKLEQHSFIIPGALQVAVRDGKIEIFSYRCAIR